MKICWEFEDTHIWISKVIIGLLIEEKATIPYQCQSRLELFKDYLTRFCRKTKRTKLIWCLTDVKCKKIKASLACFNRTNCTGYLFSYNFSAPLWRVTGSFYRLNVAIMWPRAPPHPQAVHRCVVQATLLNIRLFTSSIRSPHFYFAVIVNFIQCRTFANKKG